MAVNEQNFNFAQTGEAYADEAVRLHDSSEASHPDLRAELEACLETLGGTVKQVEGMGLSANDYSDSEKQKLANALASLSGITTSLQNIGQELGKMVRQVDGMGLSSNDFTDLDKENLQEAHRKAGSNEEGLEAHGADSVRHITGDERASWNAAVKQAKSAEDAALKAVLASVSVKTLDSGADATVVKRDDGEQIVLEFGIPKGEAGYSPVKGADYFTETDKADMVKEVLAALPDGDEVSY